MWPFDLDTISKDNGGTLLFEDFSIITRRVFLFHLHDARKPNHRLLLPVWMALVICIASWKKRQICQNFGFRFDRIGCAQDIVSMKHWQLHAVNKGTVAKLSLVPKIYTKLIYTF